MTQSKTLRMDGVETQNRLDHPHSSGRPKVSVLVITYNQEKYISQTLDGILMQVTDFQYEAVIGEDCSTDGTREVLADYRKKHAERLRIILRSANLGASRNLVQTLKECRGKYIALVEGDDYWTDPNKLQKQSDYLDSHPGCSICFHRVTPVDASGTQTDEHQVDPPRKETSSLEDIIRGNFIHTCSVMFRSGLVSDFPEWFYATKFGDWPLHVFNAQHGDIGYLPETMAAYRVHAGGTWSSIPQTERLRETLRFLNNIDAHLKSEYSGIVRAASSVYVMDLARVHAENGQWALAAYRALVSLIRSPFTDLMWKDLSIKRIVDLSPCLVRAACGTPLIFLVRRLRILQAKLPISRRSL